MENSTNKFFNRYSGKIEVEKVASGKFLYFLYNSKLGKFLLRFISLPIFSGLCGLLARSSLSRRYTKKFIEDFEIDLTDYKIPLGGFKSFDDFFTRKKLEIILPSVKKTGDKFAVFPADGRHLLYKNLNIEKVFPVKANSLSLAELCGDSGLAENFSGGFALFSRLCPVDYHRFHFPVGGFASEAKLIRGKLFSVNPSATAGRKWIFWQNKRMVTSLETDLGLVLMLEVGATNVGSIVQNYVAGEVVLGAEKGYFRMGGSLVITIWQAGKLDFAEDLVEQSKNGVELFARVGDFLASK